MKLLSRIPKSVALLFWMTLLTGLAYPFAVTAIAQLLFPGQANGSLIVLGAEVRGSRLLAQEVKSPRFFRARPSATGYAYIGSGASNLAATNPALEKAIDENRAAWEKARGKPEGGGDAPAEMLHASASGLDPDISLDAALAQVDAIAMARGYDAAMKEALIAAIRREAGASATPATPATLVGPRRVNVTSLNAELETDPGLKGTK